MSSKKEWLTMVVPSIFVLQISLLDRQSQSKNIIYSCPLPRRSRSARPSRQAVRLGDSYEWNNPSRHRSTSDEHPSTVVLIHDCWLPYDGLNVIKIGVSKPLVAYPDKNGLCKIHDIAKIGPPHRKKSKWTKRTTCHVNGAGRKSYVMNLACEVIRSKLESWAFFERD